MMTSFAGTRREDATDFSRLDQTSVLALLGPATSAAAPVATVPLVVAVVVPLAFCEVGLSGPEPVELVAAIPVGVGEVRVFGMFGMSMC